MYRSPPGRTLAYWVRATVKQARKDHGIRPRTIAAVLDIDVSRIYKFERGQHWPDNVDQILSAYAALTGHEDPREFYEKALARWRTEGTKPRIEDPTAAARVASALAAEATKRHRRE